MKLSTSILFIIFCSLFASCVILKPATSTRYGNLNEYKYIFIPPTQALNSSTVIPISGMIIPVSKSVNPRDVIAGLLAKRGYIILPMINQKLLSKTIIVNYGESDRRDLGLGAYTIEVTLQFICAETGELLCTATAEGCGSTEADDIKQAITRAIKKVFDPTPKKAEIF